MKVPKPLEAIQEAKNKLAENYKLVCDLEIECVNKPLFSERLIEDSINASWYSRGALIDLIHALQKEQKKMEKVI